MSVSNSGACDLPGRSVQPPLITGQGALFRATRGSARGSPGRVRGNHTGCREIALPAGLPLWLPEVGSWEGKAGFKGGGQDTPVLVSATTTQKTKGRWLVGRAHFLAIRKRV